MRMTPRVAGRIGRVGFRSISPRIAPGRDDDLRDCFTFPGSITDHTYKITPKNGHIVLIGIAGRNISGGGALQMTATWSGQPMTVIIPASATTNHGITGFAYIEGVPAGAEGEVVFTVTQGALESGVMRFIDPDEYVPIADQATQIIPFSQSVTASNGVTGSLQNIGLEQIFKVGVYGGIATPINMGFSTDPRFVGDWAAELQQVRVDSTIKSGSITSACFYIMQTLPTRGIYVQRPNLFSMEPGYGTGTFRAKSFGWAKE